MALQRIVRPIGNVTNILRRYSTNDKFIDVSVNDTSGIATVTMQKKPVNSLNYELLKELKTALEDLQTNRSRGMILTSSLKTVFSAGLDITEIYKPDIERAKAFWGTLQDVYIALFNSPYPTVAAINGHSPAGGCLLAMSCEYRVMVPNYTIGLNETKLGIVAPFWFISTMRNTIGVRECERALTTGKLYTTEEALKVGLIDELASDREDALARSLKFLQGFTGIHPMARAFTKTNLRGKVIEELEAGREADLETFIDYIKQPIIQKGLEVYLESLKKKNK